MSDSALPTDPPVVVVVPTFNASSFIADQLQALVHQETSIDWHLVIVDAGSSDDTIAVVTDILNRSAIRWRLVRLDQPAGVNAGLNEGIRATGSGTILIAEHDDIAGFGWISSLVAHLERWSLVGTPEELARLNSRAVINSRRRYPEDVRIRIPIANTTGMGLRRELWDALGGFDETYRYGGNDLEFCFRAYQSGQPVHIVDDAVMHYRLRSECSAAYRQGRAYGLSFVRLYEQFGPVYVERRQIRTAAKEVLRLGWWALRALRDKDYRLLVAYRGGLQIGQLEGSLRRRCWFP